VSNLKVYGKLRKLMKSKKLWKSYEVQARFQLKHDKLYSESTITRRLREMADVVAHRPSKGQTSWDYELIN